MPDEQTGTSETQNAPGGTPEPIKSFDEWMSSQPAPVQELLDKHTTGLRSALQQERDNAKSLAKELKTLSGKLDASSDAGKQIADLSEKYATAQRRADFVEEAAKAGCRDLRLAWLAAQADGLTVAQVRTQYPDLFAVQRPATNAGNGAQQPTGAQSSMNNYIRRAAGRS